MKRTFSQRMAPLLAASVLAAVPAFAQLFRAYAASYGSDANPCTIAAPCRLLPAALAAVQDGGDVWLLDSANFNSGAVTINKNVSILTVPGQVGSIVAVGGANAININAGLTVALRNVSITNNATSPGLDGIDMTTGKLSIQDSTISVPMGNGVHISGGGFLSVHNTVVRDSYTGLYVKGGATADVTGSKFINLQYGVLAEGDVASVVSSASVRDCEFTKSVTATEAYGSGANGAARLSVYGSSVSGGTYGVVAYSSASGATAVTTIGASSVSGAGTAFLQSGTGAALQSMGNNLVVNNTNATSGSITSAGGI